MTRPRAPLSVFRVEVDEDGKVLSIREVERAGTAKGGVFYVRARSEKAAGKAAYNAYHRLRLRDRRARYRAEGKCDCGRARDVRKPGSNEFFINCSACLKGMTDSKERKRRRDAGEDVPRPSVGESLRRRRQAEREEHRLEVLREVNRRFLADRQGFARWLQGEIEKLAGRSAA